MAQKVLDIGRVGGTGISKVDRYGWTRLDDAGELMWLEKFRIKVPMEYQRDQEKQASKIQGIASAFSWRKFGALSLVQRGEDFFCFDGLGRLHAALRRSDVVKVPCVVHKMATLGEEADAFIGLNTFRKAVTAVDKHAPLLISGAEEAGIVEELCRQSGRKVDLNSGPNTVSCVAQLTRLARLEPDRLRRIWPLVCDLCAGHILHRRLLEALFYIDKHMSGPDLLTDARWRNRLLKLGPDALVDATSKAAAYYAAGGARVWALGIVEAINKGLHQDNRLVIRQPETGPKAKRKRMAE